MNLWNEGHGTKSGHRRGPAAPHQLCGSDLSRPPLCLSYVIVAERGKKSLFRVGEPRKVMEEVGFERSLGGGLNFKEVRRKSLRMKKYCVAAGRFDFREGCLPESK